MCPSCNPVATSVRFFKGVEVCGNCGRELDVSDFIVISQGPAPRQPNSSFERGIRRDDRGIPYLDREGNPLRMGEPFDPRKYGEGSIVIPSRGEM